MAAYSQFFSMEIVHNTCTVMWSRRRTRVGIERSHHLGLESTNMEKVEEEVTEEEKREEEVEVTEEEKEEEEQKEEVMEEGVTKLEK